MNNTKADLKRAKEAMASKRYQDALRICEGILLFESLNVNARVMAGAALFQLERYEQCEEALKRVLDSQPDSAVALQGLVNLYERQNRQEELTSTLEQLLGLYHKSGNGVRLLELLNKLRAIREKEGDTSSILAMWQFYLPSSPYWSTIENVPERPSLLQVWRSMMEIQEAQDQAFIKREIDTRKRRLGAGTLMEIKAQVMSDIQSTSKLEDYYEQVLALEVDEQMRISIESSYLERLADRLPVAPINEKEKVRQRIDQLIEHIVKVAPTMRALEILIDNEDIDDVGSYNSEWLQQYLELDSDTNSEMGRFYRWYLDWMATDTITDETFKQLLSLKNNLFEEHVMVAHTFVWACYYYGDYTNGKDWCVRALAATNNYMTNTGRLLNRVCQSIRLCMAHCLKEMGIYTGTEALEIYEEILANQPDHIEALFGKGSVLLQQGQYKDALTVLERAHQLDSERSDIMAQLGWTMHQLGESQRGIGYLAKAIECDPQAQSYLLLGKIYWELKGDYRNDKQYAYSQFIQAAQLDLSDAFTYLGHYYRLVEKDEARSIKCYQKAYTMNPEDLEASQYLTAHLLTSKQVDAAEALLRQLTRLSLRASWIWRRLGMLELQSARSAEAINSFQRALRDDSNDSCAWEGLGEAYARQGRYTAAIKAYKRAVSLDTTAMPALLGMAEVYIKLGLHADAIECYQQALNKADTIEKEEGQHGNQALLPAWIGLADAYAVAARDHWSNGFYGRAAENCQQALSTLVTATTLSSTMHSQLGSIWKIAGDVCLLGERLSMYTQLFSSDTIRQLWENIASRKNALHTWTLEQLTEKDDNLDENTWNWPNANAFRLAMIKLAIFAYAHAMQDWSDTELCNDLSLAFYRLYAQQQQQQQQQYCEKLLKSAIDCVQAGLKQRADSSLLWNLLGVYTMKIDARLSQHAFIQAIRLDDKDPRPWVNYGYLCLHKLDIDLAKEAFTTAQTLDPECVSAWIGRALLVQSDGTAESLRLFEHALDLAGGISTEAVHGLSLEWLKSTSENTPNPLFALRKHLEGQPDDTAAWNLYTLLLERSQLYERALSANDTAINTMTTLSKSSHESAQNSSSGNDDNAQMEWALWNNRARLLSALHQFPDALRVFVQLDNSSNGTTNTNTNVTIISLVVRGITQFFCNELADSLNAFEQALTLAADNETQRAQVVLWLAQVLWALGTPEHQELAKQQLFSILGDNTNLDAIASLFVIGLVGNDATLATTALGELIQLPADVIDTIDSLAISDYLKSRFALIQGSVALARRALSKSIHRHPGNAVYWARLHALLTEFELASVKTRQATTEMLATFPVIPTAPGVSSNVNITYASCLPDNDDTNAKEQAHACRELQRALFKSPWLLNSLSNV